MLTYRVRDTEMRKIRKSNISITEIANQTELKWFGHVERVREEG